MKNSTGSLGLIVICILLLCLQSCKKQIDPVTPTGTSNATYYIRFKIDGVQKEFAKDASAVVARNADSTYSFSNAAALNSGVTKQNIVGLILLDKTKPITTNTTYTNYVLSSPTARRLFFLGITYTDESGVSYTAFADDAPASLHAIADAQTLLTEITPTRVKGTFSGTIYSGVNGVLTSKHVVTDGEFVLQRLL